jgi:hypothetical protein
VERRKSIVAGLVRIRQCRTALTELPTLLDSRKSYPLLDVVPTNRSKLVHALRDFDDPTDSQVRFLGMQIRRNELIDAALNMSATTDDTSFFDSLPKQPYKRMHTDLI